MTQEKLTLSEFTQAYAHRSGVSVLDLFSRGSRAYPCECGENDCEGFQVLHGDGRAVRELAEMLGKPTIALSVEELKVAHAEADRTGS